MSPPDYVERICIPDYGDEENYQAFLALMSSEDRAMARPWSESKANRDKLLESGSFLGKTIIPMPVTADGWESWCGSENLERTPDRIGLYATWLYICTKEEHNMHEVRHLDVGEIPE
jgi:hypothetical protein